MFLLGFALIAVGIVVGVIAVVLDYRREKATGKKRESQRGFKFKDIKYFSVSFWLLLFGSLLFYILIYPFIGIAQVFFVEKYSYQIETANIVNALVYVVPALTLPLLGFVFDWVGYKLFWGLAAVVIATLCHVVLAFIGPVFVLPILGTLSLGFAFSTYATAVWPQVFLLVQEHQSATAYGVLNCGTQIGEGAAVLIVGVIVDQLGYFLVEIFFIILGQVTLVLVFGLYLTGKGRLLNISGVEKRKAAKPQKNDQSNSEMELDKYND